MCVSHIGDDTMSYNLEKLKALTIIDKMVDSGTYNPSEIELAVLKTTGLGKGVVNTYINLNLKVGKFKISGGGNVQLE